MKKILSRRCTYVIYDADQDLSEKYGYSKYCDEHEPTEQEQDQWSWIGLITTAALTIIAFTVLT